MELLSVQPDSGSGGAAEPDRPSAIDISVARARRGTIISDENVAVYQSAFRRMAASPLMPLAHAPVESSLTSTPPLVVESSVTSTSPLVASEPAPVGASEIPTISQGQFTTLCMSELELGLSEVEIGRLWRHMDGTGRGAVNEKEFLRAVKSWRFLRRLATNYASGKVPFSVPAGYDYSKSTQENYANSDPNDFVGDFEKYRKRKDHKYHGNYSRERQLWQDAVIERVAVRTESQPEPWVVYTCGAMGAGKGYALSYMSKINAFPLENLVHIDPDAFKQIMPEWQSYVAADSRTAGTLCHKESGYLQELAQEVSMTNSQNVWVDGSLRDGDWFCKVFDQLRPRFPEYRFAIFLVSASEEVAWRRCQARALQTGRHIPEALFKDSIYAPDHVLSRLTSKVDFVARINNNGLVPMLEAIESVDFSGDWKAIADMFGKLHHPEDSPHPGESSDFGADNSGSPRLEDSMHMGFMSLQCDSAYDGVALRTARTYSDEDEHPAGEASSKSSFDAASVSGAVRPLHLGEFGSRGIKISFF